MRAPIAGSADRLSFVRMCRPLLATITMCGAGLLAAQPAHQYPSDVPDTYFGMVLELTRTTPGCTPPVASRLHGYMGLALYEAVVHGMPGHASLGPMLADAPGFPLPPQGVDLHWPTVANHALWGVMDSLFHNMFPSLRDSLHQLRDDFDGLHAQHVPLMVMNRSVAHGQAVAQTVLTYAAADGKHNCQFANWPSTYTPPQGACLWEPVPGQIAMQPYWGDQRPLLLADTTVAVLGSGPPPCETTPGSVMYEAALQVRDIVAQFHVPFMVTAGYWSDGTITTPGHFMAITNQLVRNGSHDLAFAARTYALVGMSLADAFTACWRVKYRDNFVRPVTYINEFIDPDWNTAIPTPPFPEFPSGHSTGAGAWSRIMNEVYGTSFTFTDSTHGALHGGPRTYPSFDSCAAEVGMSRIYGGIHYPFADTMGRALGGRVAQNMLALFDQAVGLPAAHGTDPVAFLHDRARQQLMLPDLRSGDIAWLLDSTGRRLRALRGGQWNSLADLPHGVFLIQVPDHRTIKLVH